MHYRLQKMNSGQSLLEIIIALGITAIMLTTAIGALLVVVQSNEISNKSRFASVLSDGLADMTLSYAESTWTSFYSLTKGSSAPYFLIPSSVGFAAVSGKEGMVSKDTVAGLMGEWKLDESSGTSVYDSSGQSNTGTFAGSPTRQIGSNCKIQGCVSLNGSTDYITIPDSSTLGLTGDVTITLWVKPAAVQIAYADLISKHGNGGYTIEQNAGSTNQFYFAWDTTGSGSWTGTSVLTMLTPNVWQYFAVVKSGSTITHYLNGVQTATGSGSGSTITTNNLPLKIGSLSAGTRVFGGAVDDVRIYNRALSTTEISNLYNSVAYDRFFYVMNVSRDPNGNIETTYNPHDDDPSTQQVTVAADYPMRGTAQQISAPFYATRWQNQVTDQTDWSGGPGQSGPITRPNTMFDRVTAGSMDYLSTPGSITATSSSCDASLGTCQFLSSVYDTGAVNGAQFNTILWQGNQPSGSGVQFKLAASNSSSGPWNYIGPPSQPPGPNVQASFDPTKFNNNRYFKVRADFTGSSGNMPRIDDIIVGWSQ